jgi:two-component system, chemotaxis family, protein-glutamate methylesterase/glutaminase
MEAPRPIKVLIVDDSAVVRRLVTEALQKDPSITIVGTANDPFIAKDRILALKPDVITLDVEMPRMDGLTFLGILMREHPLPVVMMSSLTQQGSQVAMDALRLGAVEVLAKPGGSFSFGDLGPQLIHAIKAASRARLRRPGVLGASTPTPPVQANTSPALPSLNANAKTPPPRHTPAPLAHSKPAYHGDPRRLIVLGASTGGTEALREVLVGLPAGLPPIAIVQHIPAHFSKAFADRLNNLCAFPVREAVQGELLPPGVALVAPGNFHMLLQWTGSGYRVELNSGPQVWHQRPAVDILFKSVPANLCPHVIGGVLTGMGKDGAEGLVRLRKAGATTFAQDEETSVVYGMPREAWEQGGAAVQLPLEAIATHITQLVSKPVLTP